MRTVVVLLLAAFSVTPALAASTDCTLVADSLLRLRCFESSDAAIASTSIFQKIANNPAALVACVAAILAFISGILGPGVQLAIGKRQAAAANISANAAMIAARSAGSREIAKLRLAWMDKLRDTLAEYHSILMSMEDKDLDSAAWQKLSNLGTQIDLLLNREDETQKVLWEVADQIYNMEDLKARQDMDEKLIDAGRVVLKAEWEKVKTEMRGEGFQTGAASTWFGSRGPLSR